MCGRFVLRASPEQLATLFDLPEPPALEARYNIAPTQPVGVVRRNPATLAREWALTLWGLIPSWSKDPSIGQKMINARAETAPEKPSFRAAFKRRRCLIPASGFYEWKKVADGKQPFFITSEDEAPLAFAGLWETWSSPDGGELDTCTILTTEANDMLRDLHDRMPVVVAPEDFGLWLGSGKDDPPDYLAEVRHLLRPYPPERMTRWPVSKYVNNVRNEGEACVAKFAAM
jgi:putative SOS response-associated peptidase YedK